LMNLADGAEYYENMKESDFDADVWKAECIPGTVTTSMIPIRRATWAFLQEYQLQTASMLLTLRWGQ
jgi:hypothetical protein